MSGYLLDTCAIAEMTKRLPDPGFLAWFAAIDPVSVFLSAITIGELRYGIAALPDDRRRPDLERWLMSELLPESRTRILAFDADVADRWGQILALARHSGNEVSPIDAMIAATAIAHNLAVVTRNETNFVHAGVSIFNPWHELRAERPLLGNAAAARES